MRDKKEKDPAVARRKYPRADQVNPPEPVDPSDPPEGLVDLKLTVRTTSAVADAILAGEIDGFSADVAPNPERGVGRLLADQVSRLQERVDAFDGDLTAHCSDLHAHSTFEVRGPDSTLFEDPPEMESLGELTEKSLGTILTPIVVAVPGPPHPRALEIMNRAIETIASRHVESIRGLATELSAARERHIQYLDGIGKSLEEVRGRSVTGEPVRSDREEIERLVRDLHATVELRSLEVRRSRLETEVYESRLNGLRKFADETSEKLRSQTAELETLLTRYANIRKSVEEMTRDGRSAESQILELLEERRTLHSRLYDLESQTAELETLRDELRATRNALEHAISDLPLASPDYSPDPARVKLAAESRISRWRGRVEPSPAPANPEPSRSDVVREVAGLRTEIERLNGELETTRESIWLIRKVLSTYPVPPEELHPEEARSLIARLPSQTFPDHVLADVENALTSSVALRTVLRVLLGSGR